MKELICIVCPKGCHLRVDEANDFAVTGNACPRGALYAKNELTRPTRVLTSTVAIDGALYRRCPVKTSRPIPKDRLFDVMAEISKLHLTAPITEGQVLVLNVAQSGADLLATKTMKAL